MNTILAITKLRSHQSATASPPSSRESYSTIQFLHEMVLLCHKIHKLDKEMGRHYEGCHYRGNPWKRKNRSLLS